MGPWVRGKGHQKLLERIDAHLTAFTASLARQTDELVAHREDFRRESVAHRDALREDSAAHREELVTHREELVALRRTSDLQTEELRRQSDRSDMLTHAVVRALDRLDGPRPA